ncbi:MAG: FMN-binding protein [Oscillospiraceae bacterium]|nr:FMN-binding protein [Oscillospiraceae bacterium]
MTGRRAGAAARRRAVCFLLCAAAVFSLTSCGGKKAEELSESELAAVREVLGPDAQPGDITEEALKGDTAEKYDSVKKVFLTPDGQYVFFASPVGYNGPIDIMLVIDGTDAQTRALRILAHKETEHYVRNWEDDWFTGRFAGKSAFVYLERVKLEAERGNQIVAVTGSTVSTDAVISGVNDCFDVFRSLDDPFFVETAGVVKLRNAAGEELGEITLDDIRNLDTYRRKITIRSASEGVTVHDFRGVRLSEAIAAAGGEELLAASRSVVVTGTDGYESELAPEEIALENNVYLMYEDNGEMMKTAGGSEGALRLIILSDDFGQRFTNYVAALTFIG